jgi:DNA-binding transcriptional regulator YiaG|tara:strand:- start:410 stop:619 length:210 start_codon:yes stop_codon:yes gene_type:complete
VPEKQKCLLLRAIRASGLTNNEFAKALKISRETLWRWKKSGNIPEKRRGDIAKLSQGEVTANEFSMYEV